MGEVVYNNKTIVMNDLQKRLVRFSSGIYVVVEPLKNNYLLESSIKQIIKSSTSVGANYSEAQSASSYRDFHNKIRVALKELQETHYWIAFFQETNPNLNLKELELENVELIKILSTISKKTETKTRTHK